jgi:uncharacterized protein YlzI (FlbEa/FlbD family)
VNLRERTQAMIKLTRMDGQEIAINCDQIAWLESCPDTTVRMLAGETILVREALDLVLRRVEAYRVGILREAGLAGLLSSVTVAPPPALPAQESGSAAHGVRGDAT